MSKKKDDFLKTLTDQDKMFLLEMASAGYSYGAGLTQDRIEEFVISGYVRKIKSHKVSN